MTIMGLIFIAIIAFYYFTFRYGYSLGKEDGIKQEREHSQ